MNIIEHENNILKVDKIDMDCDHVLHPDFVPPLDSFLSGFCMCIVGPSGSGKTNYLCSLLNKGKKTIKKKKTKDEDEDKDKKKEEKITKQCGFRNVFSNIYIVSPSLHTIKKSPFEDITDDWKEKELTVESLEMFEALCEEAKDEAEEKDEEPPFNLLILDDCGTKIRKDKNIERKFNEVVANRRHKHNCSIIMLLQYTTQIPPSIRSNLSHVVSFLPKSHIEKENIYTAWSGKHKKFMEQFYNFIFRKAHDTLMIDMTNRTGNYKFYRNFNEIEFE
jgi:ABC-type phosphate transport system ATPase subunit